jgi:hypothetical protein
MAVGAKLLTGLTGRPYEAFPVHNRMDHAIEMIERESATVIWGITVYVCSLVVRAQEQGRARLFAEVVSTITHSVEITPQVEFLPKDGFAEIAGGYKFNRFVDER